MAALITFLLLYSIGITVWATWRVCTLKSDLQKTMTALGLRTTLERDQ